MKKKKDKEKIGSGETGMVFNPRSASERIFTDPRSASAQILTRGDSTCDVCGRPMYDDEGREEIAVSINISDHPEADRVLKIFGKQAFNVCFVCFLRVLGVKEKKKDEEKR